MAKLNETTDEFLQQFLEQNREDLPIMIKYFKEIEQKYVEIKANEGVFSAVLSGYLTIDEYLDEYIKGTTVSCTNCTKGYCCHQTVLISEDEAIVIAQYCKENNIIISRKYLQKQLAHSKDAISTKDCSACVFLKNNRCSIYQVRPAGCRTHFTADPSEHCNTKSQTHQKIWHLSNPHAEIVKVGILSKGGKIDRMPRQLLKYSR